MFKVTNLISIIVPVYNVENYIDECINSVINQTYKYWELLLVDDGSVDASGDICDTYAQKDSRIHVYHMQNGGQSVARNYGMDQMTGEYVLFLDSDDFLAENALEVMYQYAKQYDSEIVCIGNRLYNENKKSYIGEAYVFPEIIKMTGVNAFKHMLIRDGLDSNPWGKLYLAKLWENRRFPEGHIFEDIPVTYKNMLESKCVVNTGKPLCTYRIRSTSVTGVGFSAKREDYTKFSKEVYQFVKEKYPQFEKEGRIFYLNAVVENYLRLGRLNDKKEFLTYHRFLKTEVKHYLKDILKTNYFSNTTKIAVVLNLMGVYRLIKKII